MSTAALPVAEPLAVWESDGPDFWADGAPRLPRVAWLNAVARPRISTDRLASIEFYLMDAPFAVTHRIHSGPDGMGFIGPDGKTVMKPPVIVPLAELPPDDLLRG